MKAPVSTVLILLFSGAFSSLLACPLRPEAKISFDLAQLSADGLMGPPGGKRSLDYEFCIPRGDTYQQQVKAIDPSVKLYSGSRGRIGCTVDQILCIGNTHQANWREILLTIARLPYVQRVQQVVWE